MREVGLRKPRPEMLAWANYDGCSQQHTQPLSTWWRAESETEPSAAEPLKTCSPNGNAVWRHQLYEFEQTAEKIANRIGAGEFSLLHLMSPSRWLHVAVVGIVLAESLHAQPVNDDSGGQTRASKAQDKPQTDNTPLVLETIKNEFERFTRALEANVDKSKTAEEGDRARRDLLAQEEMARWAFWMFWAALGSVILTTAGVILIWRTLVHTRRAADAAYEMVREGEKATFAAIEATKEAKRQADIAEQSFRRLERPYLLIKIMDTGDLRNPGYGKPGLQYTLVNYGKLPAILRSTSIGLLYNPSFPLVSTNEVAATRYEVIPPGTDLNQKTAVVQESANMQKIDGGNATNLYLYGLLEYNDPTGAQHTDSFCMRGVQGGAEFALYGGEEYNWSRTTPPKDDAGSNEKAS